jgi:hypothetical protein
MDEETVHYSDTKFSMLDVSHAGVYTKMHVGLSGYIYL